MNSLLVCSHCNSVISNVTPACPNCGAVTGRGRRSTDGRQFEAAPQSVFLIVVDALRAGPGRSRPASPPITRTSNDS
jgi:hypothetical protein